MNELTRVQLLTLGGDAKQAIVLTEKLKNVPELYETAKLKGYYNNVLGGIYFSMSKPREARKYYYQSIKQLSIANDSIGLKGNFINIGNTFASQTKLDSAQLFYQRASEIEALGIWQFQFSLQNNIANTYLIEHKIEKAITVYQRLIYNEFHEITLSICIDFL